MYFWAMLPVVNAAGKRSLMRRLRFETLENRALLAADILDAAPGLGLTEEEAKAVAFAASTLPAEVAGAGQATAALETEITDASPPPAPPGVAPQPDDFVLGRSQMLDNGFLNGGPLGTYRTGGTVLSRNRPTEPEGLLRQEVRRPVFTEELDAAPSEGTEETGHREGGDAARVPSNATPAQEEEVRSGDDADTDAVRIWRADWMMRHFEAIV